MNNQRPLPLYGGEYESFDPDPSWSPEEHLLWLDCQREIRAQQLQHQSVEAQSIKPFGQQNAIAKARKRASQGRIGQPSAKKEGGGEGTSRTKTKKKNKKNSDAFDKDEPCCVCQSLEHQLSGHPNPNTPQGYLSGCLPCNTLAHSFAKCTNLKPSQKKTSLFHYYRRCRVGMCPGEWHGDFQEIKDKDGNYHLDLMPLTPTFALRNLYFDERGFKHPARNGN
ncbi:hypothetical protein BDZ45DRAFT_751980 [Acephala macrosclerotiorum]|nr:hypothetical protein BDZ45DRAFT_751980 [Acephala macrosclerotiorum]